MLTILLAILTIAGCAAFTSKPEVSLYERLGGKSAIEAIVNDFVDAVGADSRITNEKVKARIAAIHIPSLKMHFTNQLCMAAGGPCEYAGRDMESSHLGLEITNAEFDYVLDDLVKTLDAYKVGEQEKNELLSLLGPMREDIVGVP